MSAVYIIMYIVLAILRMPCPFELEWMEGAMVDHVVWMLAGNPLYPEPSLDFVPFIYAPIYFYVSAGISWLIGVGFFPLRLVSVLASLGSLVVIFAFVRKETLSWQAALLASGLFAATYELSDVWFDIARVDSCMSSDNLDIWV